MKKNLGILLLILFLALLPLFTGTYLLYVTIHILLLSIFSLGFNLLFGYTGLLSFGQAGFYAAGAYGCAKILLAYPSLLFGIVGGVAVAGIASFLLGLLCIRHTRIYFSMLTLSFGMMIFSLAWKWRDMTGGDDGLVGIPRAPLEIPGLLRLNMAPMENYYYVVLVFCLFAIYVFHRIVHSPMGLTLQGIRDSVRSVNHRYLDLTVRLPEDWRSLETEVRARIGEHVRRGKVECALRYQASAGNVAGMRLNRPLAEQIARLSRVVDQILYSPAPVHSMDVLRWPGVLETDVADPEAEDVARSR